MPLNHRQERFCRFFVHYGAAATAAAAAGYARPSAKKQGWRLLRVPAIRQRIREVQAELADDHGRAEAAVLGKLEVVYQRALEARQFHAAARAAELQMRFAHRPDAGQSAQTDGPACVPEGPRSPAGPQRWAPATPGDTPVRRFG